MPDSFVMEYVGQRINFALVNEAGQFYGTLQQVGDQWVKVIVGKGKTTLIPIQNIRSISVEGDPDVGGAGSR